MKRKKKKDNRGFDLAQRPSLKYGLILKTSTLPLDYRVTHSSF